MKDKIQFQNADNKSEEGLHSNSFNETCGTSTLNIATNFKRVAPLGQQEEQRFAAE